METRIRRKAGESRKNVEREGRRKCKNSNELENAGDYEGARTALAGLWSVIGERPQIEKLEPRTQAEVMLRVGSLAGWLGSSRQIAGAQEFAKDLIGESIRAFEALGDEEK